MEPTSPGDLVRVASGGPELDGIVFDTPSRHKVVVAVVDPQRGPSFRTVAPETLTVREDEAPADKVLWALIRRTAPANRGGARDGAGTGHGRAGHARGTMHRTTGK